MCGITGIFTLNPHGDEETIIKSMNDNLIHRGPDDEGYFTGKNIHLGMRRLSIVDLGGGHQPIYNEDKNLVLILNGEIYNYVELREELIKKGHAFRTKSDAEVVLHLYEERGIDALNDLNGMFAFCLWDDEKKEGFIARDRLGIKFLYYWQNKDTLYFASELKALINHVPKIIDQEAILAYLQYMYIPAPLTPFKDIKKLMPASYMHFSLKGIDKSQIYWHVPIRVDKYYLSETIKKEFYTLIDESVSMQLRSDVPVGILLSGGIDSSLVTAFAAKKMQQEVHTFNVKYIGAQYDETEFAREVAEYFNCRHHIIEIDTKDVIEHLPKIIWHMDEPHADSAMIGTYMVSKLASKHVKVVLNGTGGDELFAGYPYYLEGSLRNLKFTTGRLLNILKEIALKNNKRSALVFLIKNFKSLVAHAQFNPYQLTNFNQNYELPYISKNSFIKEIDGNVNRTNKMLYEDVAFYLTDDLLLILDKMTMASSVEGRVPILDHKLVEWAFSIDGDLKILNNQTKFLLKNWLRSTLPAVVLDRPKMGFGAPVRYWMKNGLREESFRLLSERPESRKELYWGLRGRHLKNKVESLNPQQCFALLVLELYFKLFVDGIEPETPINRIK
jgi:asparagine synthase (glutamine-hydrolysing)